MKNNHIITDFEYIAIETKKGYFVFLLSRALEEYSNEGRWAETIINKYNQMHEIYI
jgi:hypothetical protein